jgi:DNA-binding CsgD family transcriptional regulator
MEHIVLFLYFLLLSSGFAGITVTLILVKRFRFPPLGWIAGVMIAFTLWLLLRLIVFYIESILPYPVTVGYFLGPVNLVVGFLVYLGLFITALTAAPRENRPFLALSAVPLLLFYILAAAFGPFIPALREVFLTRRGLVQFISVLCSALFLGAGGVGFLRAARSMKSETLEFLFRWIGWITMLFAPVSLVVAAIGWALGISGGITVPLNYVYFSGWNVMAVLTFIRYSSRPSALIHEGTVSEGFIREYKISKRETEIIDLISHGLSNKEIASQLNVSLTTVRTHVYNIFKKAGAGSRVELLRIVSGYRE